MLQQRVRAFTPARAPARSSVRCVAAKEVGDTSRRQVLTAGGVLLVPGTLLAAAAPPAALAERFQSVTSLSTFQRAAQRNALAARAFKALAEVLTAADAPAALRLLLADAVSFDIATGAGGVNGSIVLPEELSRPGNADLKPLVAKLAAAKQSIDEEGAKVGQPPISWADLEVLAARACVTAGWRAIKIGRAETESGGKIIADAYATEWPVRLGRVDAIAADAPALAPAPDADVAAIKAFFGQLGAKPGSGGPFTPKPPFWERPTFLVWPATFADAAAEEARLAAGDPAAFGSWKKTYDASRLTVTRNAYEVDFVDAFDKLASLGAKFDPQAYLYPEPMGSFKL